MFAFFYIVLTPNDLYPTWGEVGACLLVALIIRLAIDRVLPPVRSTAKPCWTCSGRGMVDGPGGEPETCYVCKGERWVSKW